MGEGDDWQRCAATGGGVEGTRESADARHANANRMNRAVWFVRFLRLWNTGRGAARWRDDYAVGE
jgi:hypothetical protein